MTLTDSVRRGIEHGTGARVDGAVAIGGGCICPAYRVRLSDGVTLFVKTAPADAAENVFTEEARSLGALAATTTVRVPAVVGVTAEWLALEWLEPVAGSAAQWAELGRQLAALHAWTATNYGWPADNYIGPLPQANGELASWPEFWRERRLLPQLARAATQLGHDAVTHGERLCSELEERLGPAAEEGPSLLHGDLWSGNVHMTQAVPALVDPASYYGHREVDLAMAILFGGFDESFYDAYDATWTLQRGARARLPVYQLYYLLVHVNLFGGGYIEQTRLVLRALGRVS